MKLPDSRSLHVKQDDEPQVENDRCRYFWRFGWNSCRDAMLSATPAPPADHIGDANAMMPEVSTVIRNFRNTADNPPEVSWNEAQRISDMPQVYEALSNFACDTTGDNGEAIVRAILGVIKATPPEVKPVGWLGFSPMDTEPSFSYQKPTEDAIRQWNYRQVYYTSPPSPKAAPPATEELRTRVADAISKHLGDALFCSRSWNAWGVGTMTQRDFCTVSEDGEVLMDAVDEVLKAILPSPTRIPSQMPPEMRKEIDEYLKNNHVVGEMGPEDFGEND